MNIIKNIKALALAAIASASLASCNDFLTRDYPTGVTDADFWRTQNECEAALAQCKVWPQGTYHYTAPNIALVHMEGATDNEYFSSNFQNVVTNMGNGSLTPTTGGYQGDVWSTYYAYIRRCCRFLEHVGDAYFTVEKDRQRLIADCRVWRAWYHMQLLLWYGRNDGIPIVEKALAGDEIYQPRKSVEECLAFINKELDDVISITDDEICPFLWNESNRTRMSRAYALVLKMDLNLQFKKYDVAMTAAKQLIDSGAFSLYKSNTTDDDPGKSYRDLHNYAGEQNDERIMYVAYGLWEYIYRCMPISLGGQGTCSVTKSLVDDYELADGRTLSELSQSEREAIEKAPLSVKRDPRLYCTVMVPGDNTSIKGYTYEPFNASSSDYYTKNSAVRSGYVLKKWFSENDRSSKRTYFPFVLYRYAEVLLDYVECLIETGRWNDPDVEKYINEIRNRAGMPNMDKEKYNTQEKVRELYRRERRVELCFEGKRYDDIRRWGIGDKVMNGQVYGAWNPNSNSFVSIEERRCIFPKYDSWPLPQTEATANPNINQPTGWPQTTKNDDGSDS